MAAEKYEFSAEGNNDAATAEVLAELAGLIDRGVLDVPIAKVCPPAEVRDAYRELESATPWQTLAEALTF